MSRTFVSKSCTFRAPKGLSIAIDTKHTHAVLRRRPQSFNYFSCTVSGKDFYSQRIALDTFYFNYVKLRTLVIDCIKLFPFKGKACGCDILGCHTPF